MASAPAADCGITSLNRWWPKLPSLSSAYTCFSRTQVGFWLVFIAWWCGCGVLADAGESAFDTAHLRDRTKCVGIFLGRDAQYAFLAVRRAAVGEAKGSLRSYLNKADEDEKVAYQQLRDRTQAMLQEPDHDEYRFLLEQELDRASRWLSGEGRNPSELVILSIPLGDVIKWEIAGRENHALATWAWRKQIDAPESIDSNKLRELLQQANVDWKQDLPDLGSRFQAMPQNGDEWRARMAIVRYSRDREIEFQGTAGMMVRVGDRNAQADIGKLLAQGVQQQSQDLLGELLDGRKAKRRDWLESCREMLKEERDDYFRASCMEQEGVGGDGFVESVFVVRFGNDWKPIWKSKVPIDIRSVPDTTQKQVENDPQIRSLLTLVESLGVGSKDVVDRAVKMGAATMQAQSQVNQQFEFFRQRYQHRLDIPVLRWEVTSPDRLPRR